jgi:hypothetical protein
MEFTSKKPTPFKEGSGRFSTQLRRNHRDALNDVGRSVRDRVRKPIKRHPGADSLYNSIKLERATAVKMDFKVSTSHPMAWTREKDMPPHEIRPSRAKMLRFIRRGQVIFAKSVDHPGSRGTHSWQHAATANRARLPWAMKYATEAAFKLQPYSKRYS